MYAFIETVQVMIREHFCRAPSPPVKCTGGMSDGMNNGKVHEKENNGHSIDLNGPLTPSDRKVSLGHELALSCSYTANSTKRCQHTKANVHTHYELNFDGCDLS